MGLQPVISDAGSNYLTRCLLRDPATAAGDWILRLFSNPLDIVVSTVVGDFVECAYSGYVGRVLDPLAWLPPFFGFYGSTSYYQNQPQIWTIGSGSASVAGWYITLDTSLFIWGQTFNVAYNLTPSAPLVIQPVWAGIGSYRPM